MAYQKNNKAIRNKSTIIKKLTIIFLVGAGFSQSFAQYEIKKHSINSGTETMVGGGFEMKSSIGQVDASSILSGGDFSLNAGFWQENNDLIFKNNFE